MRESKEKKISAEYISADLQEEILLLLPSHDLHNFRRVCKAWNQLISSHRFIQEHARRSNRTLIITLSPTEILVCDDPAVNKFRWSIRYPPRFTFHNTRIVGSCDGLVCLVRSWSRAFAIINPSTGESDVRATDGIVFHPRRSFWFGKHPSTGEYLIIGVIVRSEIMTEVYRLSSQPTSHFSIPPTVHSLRVYCCDDSIPILLHGGALHWAGYRDLHSQQVVVLAYDLQDNKVSKISTPFRSSYVRLGIVDGCLFAIVHRNCERFDLWIMREYGVEESWTQYCNIEVFEGIQFCNLEEFEGIRGSRVLPLGFLPDGDLVLKVGNRKIVKYNFSGKKFTDGDLDLKVGNRKIIMYGYSGRKVTGFRDIVPSSAVLCDDSLVSPSLIWGNCSPLPTRE